MKVQFAPGAFDDFDGTQEELDALITEVKQMFESMTPDELAAQSNEVDFADLPDCVQADLVKESRTLQ
jgi:hypothetical protein